MCNTLLRFFLTLILFWTSHLFAAEQKVQLILGTVGVGTPGVNVADGKVDKDRPGWFVELSKRAAKSCGAKVSFKFSPWARTLELVKRGEISAAFGSSYTKDRTTFGVYPMKNGKPDEYRASKRYAYFALVSKDSKDKKLIDEGKVEGLRIVVERNASIIPYLKKRGAAIFEAASYETIVRMVAIGDRVDAAVGIDNNIDGALDIYPEYAPLLLRSKLPVQKKVGYVMFSKIFYEQHMELVECFWTTSAELKATDWFKAIKLSYG
jgi:polar amino acid transport system substrate-binding protein